MFLESFTTSEIIVSVLPLMHSYSKPFSKSLHFNILFLPRFINLLQLHLKDSICVGINQEFAAITLFLHFVDFFDIILTKQTIFDLVMRGGHLVPVLRRI